MAVLAALNFKLQKQGQNKPANTKPKHTIKGDVEVLWHRLGVISPYDIAHGQASGKRQWQPFEFIFESRGGVTEQIIAATTTNETIQTLVFTMYRLQTAETGLAGGSATGTGGEVPFETYTLTNGQFVSVEVASAFDELDGAMGGGAKHMSGFATHELVKVKTTFQKIDISNVQSKVTVSDDWTAA